MAVVNAGIAFIQGYNSSVRFLASLYLTFSFGRNLFVYEIFCAHLFPSFLCSLSLLKVTVKLKVSLRLAVGPSLCPLTYLFLL